MIKYNINLKIVQLIIGMATRRDKMSETARRDETRRDETELFDS